MSKPIIRSRNVDDNDGRCSLAASHPDFVALVNADRIIRSLLQRVTDLSEQNITDLAGHDDYMRKLQHGKTEA